MNRGVRLDDEPAQLGGNTDFYNMLERDRSSRRRSPRPTRALQLGHELPAEAVHIGQRLRAWLADRKWAAHPPRGSGFGDQPINVELKARVWDSPNSAGVVVDAIRAAGSRSTVGSRAPSWPRRRT